MLGSLPARRGRLFMSTHRMREIVDRGTRFFVNVAESAATEVHVVDGVADIFQSAKSDTSQTEPSRSPEFQRSPSAMVRLTKNEAGKVESNSNSELQPTDFKSSLYQYRLPDRVIAYQATQENGGAKNLLSVDVQRDGRCVAILSKN